MWAGAAALVVGISVTLITISQDWSGGGSGGKYDLEICFKSLPGSIELVYNALLRCFKHKFPATSRTTIKSAIVAL